MLWKILSLSYRIYRAQTHSNSHIESGVTCSYPYHLVGRLKLSLSLHFSPIADTTFPHPQFHFIEPNSKNKYHSPTYVIKISNKRHSFQTNLPSARKKSGEWWKSQPQCHQSPWLSISLSSTPLSTWLCVCVFENLNGKNILILIKAFRC